MSLQSLPPTALLVLFLPYVTCLLCYKYLPTMVFDVLPRYFFITISYVIIILGTLALV